MAGQPAYTVRVSPSEGGSLLGGAELSFDAVNGVPLRAAVYSSTSSSPVIELAATEVSYGPVANSVFAFTPAGERQDRRSQLPEARRHRGRHAGRGRRRRAPNVTTHGQRGRDDRRSIESKAKAGTP